MPALCIRCTTVSVSHLKVAVEKKCNVTHTVVALPCPSFYVQYTNALLTARSN